MKTMKILQSLVLVLFCITGCSRNGDLHAVTHTFEGYKTAILNDDGNAAYELADENTRRWYGETLERVLNYDRAEIMKLGILDKMQVIIIRHRIPSEELLKMTGEDLFKYAVNHGWVGKNSVSGLEIGEVDIQGDFATGVVQSNGQESPLRFHFYRQEGHWGIDLTEMNKWGEAAFAQQIKESGETEMDFILKIVQMVSGEAVQESIWTPLGT